MIKVTAEDINDLKHKLGIKDKVFNISIKWKASDFGRKSENGCIVDATNTIGGGEVPKEFKSNDDALEYIKLMFKDRNDYIDAGEE